jgi:hypothetical protein
MYSSYCLDCQHTGEEKAKFHWTKVALLAIVAGTYCGFGFTLCLIVGGNAPKSWLEDSPGLFSLLFGAVGFPFSFTLVRLARRCPLVPCCEAAAVSPSTGSQPHHHQYKIGLCRGRNAGM